MSSTTIDRDRAIAKKLIHGYLSMRLHLNGSNGISGLNYNQLDPLSADLLRCLISLTSDYEERYKQQLLDLSNSWTIDASDPHRSFVEVLDAVFVDGCNWGRIVTVFIFVGMYLNKCRQQRVEIRAGQVADWAVDYLAEKVAPWIHSNGDWVGLVKFCDTDSTRERLHEDDEIGGLLRRLVPVACAATLFVLGLTTWLASRT